LTSDLLTRLPVADREAAQVLGSALRRVGYSSATVERVFGEDAYSIDRDDALVAERRLPQTPIGTVARLLFLQLRVPVADAVSALGRRSVEALVATGLAEVGDEVVPLARILPIGDVLLASDGYSLGRRDPPDYVAGFTPTSRVLDALTPRPQVARALDVGTGSGVHALLAAGHAGSVVATDVNPRALAYTELNAALNGLTNIECRSGSLFEPVRGERFDLITCNAPFVVSPERRWVYRDGGLEADEMSALVVREAAAHLADGGFASLLVSWVADDEDAPDERALAWAEATGCDSWILSTMNSDPLEHAAGWNSDLGDDPQAFDDALAEWTDYLDALGVRRVSEGAILLHRRPGGRPTVRVDELDEDELEVAGEQIERAFAARARLAELGRSADLLDARLDTVMAMRVERELEPRNGRATVVGARIHLDEGTSPSVETTADALEVVASLDGRVCLGEVVEIAADRLKLSERQAASLRDEAVSVSRELLELGALRLR
jgi:methylase of polypeptide subunit release factors